MVTPTSNSVAYNYLCVACLFKALLGAVALKKTALNNVKNVTIKIVID